MRRRDVLLAASTTACPSAQRRGLGLWMVRRLVNELGGAIAIDGQEPDRTRPSGHHSAPAKEKLADVA